MDPSDPTRAPARLGEFTEPPAPSDGSRTAFALQYEGLKLDNDSVTIRVLSGLLRRIVFTRTGEADAETVRVGTQIGSTMDFEAAAAARARAEATRRRREQGDAREHLAAREERSRAATEASAAECLRLMVPTLEKIYFDRNQIRHLAENMTEDNADRVEVAIDDYRARTFRWHLKIAARQRRYVELQDAVIDFARDGGAACRRDLVAYLLGILSIHGDPQGGLYECAEISAPLWARLGDLLAELPGVTDARGAPGELEGWLGEVDLANLVVAGRTLADHQRRHFEAAGDGDDDALPFWNTHRHQVELLEERLGLGSLPAPRLVFFPNYEPLREARSEYRDLEREHLVTESMADTPRFLQDLLDEAKAELDRDGDGTAYQEKVKAIRAGETSRKLVEGLARVREEANQELKEKEGTLYFEQLSSLAEHVLETPRASALECYVLAARDAGHSIWGGETLVYAAERLAALLAGTGAAGSA